MSSVFYRVSQELGISIPTVAFFVAVFCPMIPKYGYPPSPSCVSQEFITEGLPVFISLEFTCFHHDFVFVCKNNYRVIEREEFLRNSLKKYIFFYLYLFIFIFF